MKDLAASHPPSRTCPTARIGGGLVTQMDPSVNARVINVARPTTDSLRDYGKKAWLGLAHPGNKMGVCVCVCV
eukprot:3966769-Pyramimonas_sp.AAC.2